MPDHRLKPIIPWTGGKRRLLPELTRHAPTEFGRYFEPFAGGAALLFSLQPKEAILNDANTELINCYNIVKADPDALLELLGEHARLDSKEYFLQVRAMDREPDFLDLDPVIRAARMIYIVRAAFSTLYRVNKQGFCNSPYGNGMSQRSIGEDNIRKVSEYFNNNSIEFRTGDFVDACEEAQEGDFVYLDPPYFSVAKDGSLFNYSADGFNLEDQHRVKQLVDDLSDRGVFVMASNAACDEVFELYKDYTIHTPTISRTNGGKNAAYGKIQESLIVNF